MRLPAKFADRIAQEQAGSDIPDESNEVAGAWINEAKPEKRIALRARLIRVIADRFQADHSADSVTALPAARGINIAAHLRGQEIAGLLIYEGDEAQRSGVVRSSETACEGQ